MSSYCKVLSRISADGQPMITPSPIMAFFPMLLLPYTMKWLLLLVSISNLLRDQYSNNTESNSDGVHGDRCLPLGHPPVVRKHPFQGKGVGYVESPIVPLLPELHLGVL